MKIRARSDRRSALHNQKGFSLIEIMVTVGVLIGVTYAIVMFMQQTGKQAASVASKGDFNTLINELQGVFNNSSSCMRAFGGDADYKNPTTGLPEPKAGFAINATLDKDHPQAVTLKVGKDTGLREYKAGEAYGKGLTIMKLQLVEISEVSNGQYKLVLELHTSRRMGEKTGTETAVKTGSEAAVGGDAMKPHIFNILVSLDNPATTRKVIRCSGQYSNYWVEGTVSTPIDPDNSFPISYMGGFVGIRTTTPGALFDVAGISQAQAFMYNSDARLKENVRDLSSPLEKVLKLRGVLFDWKDRKGEPDSTDRLGLIAQEVEKVYPEAVVTSPTTGMKSVGYGNLVAPLIEAIKEQQAQLERQSREIEELKRKIEQR